MREYLKMIFGKGISFRQMTLKAGAPYYLADGYILTEVNWQNNRCIVAEPVSDGMRLPALKSHAKEIYTITGMPCALNLKNITSAQRSNLIESNIPFICVPFQVYFPFWGSCFSNKFNREIIRSDALSIKAQLALIYLMYNSSSEVNYRKITEAIRISKASCTRAMHELVDLGYVYEVSEGNKKWIELNVQTASDAVAHMKSPVDKYVYMKELPENVKGKYSGLNALEKISMISAKEKEISIAMSRDSYKMLDTSMIISENEYKDFGGYCIEVWNYSPDILSSTEYVDELSLMLSLSEDKDERVQKELDVIREKYGIFQKNSEC